MEGAGEKIINTLAHFYHMSGDWINQPDSEPTQPDSPAEPEDESESDTEAEPENPIHHRSILYT